LIWIVSTRNWGSRVPTRVTDCRGWMDPWVGGVPWGI